MVAGLITANPAPRQFQLLEKHYALTGLAYGNGDGSTTRQQPALRYLQLVPHSPDGHDEAWVGRVGFDLLAEGMDVNIQGMLF